MKKLITLICVLAAFQFSSCKQEVKKEDIKQVIEEPVKTFAYSLKESENTVKFIAYKTSEKLPVKGMFKKLVITKQGEGNTIKEAINGAEFKIPVSSIETKDDSRNMKIQKFFFGIMENSLSLTGKLMINDDNNGALALTMNGMTELLPFTYTIVDKVFTMDATMDLGNWKGATAIAALNEACKDLHKGPDGVSKTWNEVAVGAVCTFK